MKNSSEEFLLKLARRALEHIFKTGKELRIDESEVPEKYKKVGASFITLTKNGQLRGCIGKLYPTQEIYKDVIENSYAAAFNDIRFPQLTKEEFKNIKIEVSILDTPKKLDYKDEKDLVEKLRKEKPGVIIKKSMYSATYLPQVWEELSDPEEFLSSLCQKAGLAPNDWKKGNLEIETYKVKKFKEE